MSKRIVKGVFSVLLAVMVAGGVVSGGHSYAGERGESGGKEGYNRDRDYYNERDYSSDSGRGERGERFVPPAKDSVYSRECGSCHFLYFPGFLPQRSWVKLMTQQDHFGETLELKDTVKGEITKYLTENSADRQRRNGISNKIMSSLGALSPTRVTDVPYIVRKHRKIRRSVFDRPSVGTFSNCGACHLTGHEGDFEEDNVKIPQ